MSKALKIKIIFLVLAAINNQGVTKSQQVPLSSLSVLAIGNANYSNNTFFASYPDIDSSASDFLDCFLSYSNTRWIMKSKKDRLIRKVDILNMVTEFINHVQSLPSDQNIGIIYYCGHGVCDLSGNMYFVPGDIDVNLADTTFEFLSQKLLAVDDLVRIIINSQELTSKFTRYYIIGDCCSDAISSKLYKGITYEFKDGNTGVVTYDSMFLRNINSTNSTLKSSLELLVDSSGNIIKPKIDPTKPIIDEFAFIPSLIRHQTFEKNGNAMFYSSELGKTTMMVSPIDSTKLYDVGPLCRRTVKYFTKKNNAFELANYLSALTLKEFDNLTMPVIIRGNRNLTN